jgi:hypothetical protein
MSQPVKLSDELVLSARLNGESLERSIAGQIEFWARLGRAIEPVLQVRQAKALAEAPPPTPVSECVKIVGSEEGDQRLREYLNRRPFPHYEAAPDAPGLLIRTEANGKKTIGRFVNREFKAVSSRRK